MREIFISYATEDGKIANEICSALEQRGIRCWIAPRDVPPGAEYAEALTNAIHEAHGMVLVFSSKSNNSRQVKAEVQAAFDKGKIIIPFRIEDTKPTGAMAHYINTFHWLDAFTPPLERYLKELTTWVERQLNIPVKEPSAGADEKPAVESLIYKTNRGKELQNINYETTHGLKMKRPLNLLGSAFVRVLLESAKALQKVVKLMSGMLVITGVTAENKLDDVVLWVTIISAIYISSIYVDGNGSEWGFVLAIGSLGSLLVMVFLLAYVRIIKVEDEVKFCGAGFWLRPDASEELRKNKYSFNKLIKWADFDQSMIWPELSIASFRVTTVICGITLLFSMTFMVTAFLQQRVTAMPYNYNSSVQESRDNWPLTQPHYGTKSGELDDNGSTGSNESRPVIYD